jgi:hypothetical protein
VCTVPLPRSRIKLVRRKEDMRDTARVAPHCPCPIKELEKPYHRQNHVTNQITCAKQFTANQNCVTRQRLPGYHCSSTASIWSQARVRREKSRPSIDVTVTRTPSTVPLLMTASIHRVPPVYVRCTPRCQYSSLCSCCEHSVVDKLQYTRIHTSTYTETLNLGCFLAFG